MSDLEMEAIMAAKRTPQEKKKLSLELDRRNAYGNNRKAARKCIPKSKQLGNRSARHAADVPLALAVGPFDEGIAEAVDNETKCAQIARKGTRFSKWPDKPLGEILKKKLG
jgi:hypothetical protein